VPTGLRVAIPEGFEMQIRPRSGLALKHGISLPNTPGTIDSDYRGPLGGDPGQPRDEPFVVEHGARIAQAVVAPVVQASFAVVDALARPRGARAASGPPGSADAAGCGSGGRDLGHRGLAMGVPRAARLNMLGLLYVAVLAVQVALPGASGAGGHRRVACAVADPRRFRGAGAGLSRGAEPVARAGRAIEASGRGRAHRAADGPFSNAELERYARHITLPDIGGRGQLALKEAKVLVVGAGGLGRRCCCTWRRRVWADRDHRRGQVALSNLQRQVIHTDARQDMPKVFSAQIAIEALNPHVEVRPYNRALTEEIAEELFAEYDLILDGTDSSRRAPWSTAPPWPWAARCWPARSARGRGR
jgi:dUTPase